MKPVNFLAYVTIQPQAWQPEVDKIADSPMGDNMYALEHIFDSSNLLDTSLSEPLPDEIDGQDQMLDAKLRTELPPRPPDT
jgi:hypothetical protein